MPAPSASPQGNRPAVKSRGSAGGSARASNHDSALSSVRDRLLQRIHDNTDLPAIGSAVARVVRLASSDDEALRELAHFILADVALTQKILRLANSVSYRNAGDRAITTISKAIFALGFDTVKTSALAMMLADAMGGEQGEIVRVELKNAVRASIIGRELAKRSHAKDVEEVSIVALFKNIGRVLVAAHDHDAYAAIAELCERDELSVVEAAAQILHCSFESLGDTVLRDWRMPESIILAIAPLPIGAVKVARSRQEWLQQVATFSALLAQIPPSTAVPAALAPDAPTVQLANASTMARAVVPDSDDEATLARDALLTRFGEALNLDAAQLDEICRTVDNEFALYGNEAIGDRQAGDAHDAIARAITHEAIHLIPSELRMSKPPAASATPNNARHPSGKPLNARHLLMAGVSDVTELRASSAGSVNDLLTLVLEILLHSLGFRFAALCVRDAAGKQYRARVALGANSGSYQAGFHFSIETGRDLFHLALDNDVDLFIADANEAKIRALIPAWHHSALADARSFIVLPLIVNKKPFGLFYADRNVAAPEGIPADEAALITALKGQVLAALGAR